jgi:type IV pilus assembly protein PilQ
MTVTRGLALILTVATAGAFVKAAAPPDTRASVRLTAISARVGSKGASLIIEASEPVAYTTSRPDPLTVLLDFRNVGGQEVANSVAADVKSPIARVSVETAESLGAPASRVRIALSKPVAHHVRSERNTVVVDFERPSVKAAPYVLPPAARRSGGEPPAPDAMQALHETPAQDPIAALGLDNAVGGPSAVSSPSVTQPVSQPKVVQSAGAMAAQLAAAQSTIPQPPAPPTPQADQPAPGPRGRQFTGHPISLDFQGADLRAVLRTFAEISALNIVIDPTIQGTVDVSLRDVPWDQALDIILRANKLGYLIDGTIVRIAPLSVLADEESQRRKLSEEQALAGQLSVLTKTLSYAKASELEVLLTLLIDEEEMVAGFVAGDVDVFTELDVALSRRG